MTGFPRDVDHEVGSTRIEASSERVVAVTDGAELVSLLAVGRPPIGFGQRNPISPWIAAARGADPAIERYDLVGSEVNFEVMARWRPDVIVGQVGFVTADTIGDYSAIAPTVATQSVDWRVSLAQVARTIGAEDRAQQVADELETRIIEVAEAVAGIADLRFAWLHPFNDGSFFISYANSAAGLLIADLGLRPLPAPPAPTAGAAVDERGSIPAEQVGGIDADAFVLFDYTDDQVALQQAEASPLWANLPAVQAGRVVKLDLDTSRAAGRGSVLGIPVLLDAIERTLPGLAG